MGYIFNNLCAMRRDIDMAVFLASIAGEDEDDLNGQPAILHSFAVAALGRDNDERAVGLLHDFVKNNDEDIFDFEDMKNARFSKKEIKALRLLVHNPHTSYSKYIHKIKKSGNELAIRVKINDLRCEINRDKIGNHIDLLNKHTQALWYLVCNDEAPQRNKYQGYNIRGFKYEWKQTSPFIPEQYDIYKDGCRVAYYRIRRFNLEIHPYINDEIDWETIIYSTNGNWCGNVSFDDVPFVILDVEDAIDNYLCRHVNNGINGYRF